MKKLLIALALAVLAFGGTGCVGMASVVKAASKDPAFVTVQVRTIYGTAFLTRDGRPNSGTTVSPEGAVTSTPPTNIIQRVELSPAAQQLGQQLQAQQRAAAHAAAIKGAPAPARAPATSTNAPPVSAANTVPAAIPTP